MKRSHWFVFRLLVSVSMVYAFVSTIALPTVTPNMRTQIMAVGLLLAGVATVTVLSTRRNNLLLLGTIVGADIVMALIGLLVAKNNGSPSLWLTFLAVVAIIAAFTTIWKLIDQRARTSYAERPSRSR